MTTTAPTGTDTGPATDAPTLTHWIGGAPTEVRGPRFRRDQPGDRPGRRAFPLARAEEMGAAVAAATKAFPAWRDASLAKRTPILFAFRELLNARKGELAAIITAEHGKVLSDALGEVTRGQEVVEFACGMPHLLKGGFTENASTGVDVHSVRQPLGVVAIISPFNFPAMVPMWFFPIAIAAGNTVVLKPSEKDPSAALLDRRAVAEAGLPDGVFNVVQGDKVAVDAAADAPGRRRRSRSSGRPRSRGTSTRPAPRRQAGAGTRRRQEPHGRAARRRPRPRGRRGGQRRLRLGRGAVHGDLRGGRGRRIADELVAEIADRAGCNTGDGTRAATWDRWSPRARDQVAGYVDAGAAGATLVVDGRDGEPDVDGEGFLLGPTLFDHVTPT